MKSLKFYPHKPIKINQINDLNDICFGLEALFFYPRASCVQILWSSVDCILPKDDKFSHLDFKPL